MKIKNFYQDKKKQKNTIYDSLQSLQPIIKRNKANDLEYIRYFSGKYKKILDAGCSVGNFISIDPKHIIGIDIDRRCLDICRKRGFKVLYSNLNHKLPFKDNTFDLIRCWQVIEHLPNPEFTFKEFKRILKPGGKLIVMTCDISREKFRFWSETITHITPFGFNGLYELAYNSGFRDFEVRRGYYTKGSGWLVRRFGCGIKFTKIIQEILYKLGITNNDLILIAKK
ncbi:MAG: class I SAM-dependent methyltransferase [Candidatus Aenigmatarchaeota archaeon]